MRRSPRAQVAAYGLVAVVLVACGGDGGPTGPSDGGDGEQLEPGEDPAGDGADAPMTDGDPLPAAVRDAAERADVDPAMVEVVINEQVTWSDGALGCPQDDQFYTQALVEGYRVVVEAGGRTLHYHGRTGGPPAYCADPEAPASDATTGTDA